MHLRTFSAGTMAEALYQVKSAMGNDAVILHTRTYRQRRWLGLRRREVVVEQPRLRRRAATFAERRRLLMNRHPQALRDQQA